MTITIETERPNTAGSIKWGEELRAKVTLNPVINICFFPFMQYSSSMQHAAGSGSI
jgi:hypothetical protein